MNEYIEQLPIDEPVDCHKYRTLRDKLNKESLDIRLKAMVIGGDYGGGIRVNASGVVLLHHEDSRKMHHSRSVENSGVYRS